jgi:DHA1 family bicyclomycin/chloramphenicol resistance-like MFS transporter
MELRSGSAPPARMLALLVAIASVGPMSLNIVMPALPAIAIALATDAETVQLTLSLYLVCMAVSQLIVGPLSDRFGRRPVLIAGLLLTVLASIGALLASTIAGLVIMRALQALGASTGIVSSRAIIRDLYERDRAASMIGWVTMVIMVVPMMVPPLGGLLAATLGWPAIFACIALFASAVLVWVSVDLPETLAVPAGGGGFVRFLQDLGQLLTSRAFICYVLCGATGSALFFAFLGGAPHVVVTLMGRSAFELGLWFATVSFAYMLGNYVSANYSIRFGLDAMVAAGTLVGIVGGIAAVLLVLALPHGGPVTIFLPQWITAFANGLLLPNVIAGAISVRPHAAGTAAGITGFMQMFVGAAAAQWVSHLLVPAETAMPMALIMLGAALACGVANLGLIGLQRAPR